MKTIHHAFTATAQSSITHGGNQLGTVLYLRRERFLTPTGPEEIPVISGNAMRGVLRDLGATMTWEALGQPKLTLGATDVLWSGGALTKAKREPVTGARLAEIRHYFPHVGLFGAAGGGRLIEGSLSVGKLLPICTQTEPFLPPGIPTPAHDLWDLLQVEELSRFMSRSLPQELAPTGAETASEGNIRFGVETFIAGTAFSTWWSLTNATDEEHSFWVALLNRFAPTAHVGGKNAAGYGRITFDPPSMTGEEVDWSAAAKANPERAREVIEWLN